MDTQRLAVWRRAMPMQGGVTASTEPGLLPACRAGARHGFALVLVLAMLVLVAGLVTAYFSRALQEQRAGGLSTAQTGADLLAESATRMILADFFDEMTAGSQTDEQLGHVFLRPLLVPQGPGEAISLAPSAAPQEQPGLDVIPGLIKTSRAGVTFYEATDGYLGVDGPARASPVNSVTAPSLNGRFISAGAWNLPRLMTDTEFAQFQSPDWIYLNRGGETPVPTADTVDGLADSAPDNADFVLGRFAYAVYDVGGLIDVNVAGNALPTEMNQHRGHLHQLDLSEGINGTAMPGFADFITDWRWPWLQDFENQEDALDFLTEPTRSFLVVEDGGQAFVTRQDLLTFVEEGQTGIPDATLPFMTVDNRTLNRPDWRPNPDYWEWDFWSEVGVGVEPEEFNPDLVTVRFPEETVLTRGGSEEVTVPAGTPVMPRRFPLGKLEVFNRTSPNELSATDEANLLYYFGLEPTDEVDTYRYVRAETTPEGPRIARLEEVAGQGREPNFFEILRAVILAGSLGKTAGHSMTIDVARDGSGDLHALQIGANIIDQWDSDDMPTTIDFPEGGDDPWEEPLQVYGTENLPYINQFLVVPHRPAHDRDRLQYWAVFDVWNPHQNALNLPNVGGLRIVPLGGTFYDAWVFYAVNNFDPTDYEGGTSWRSVSSFRRPGEDILETNEELLPLGFAPSIDFAEPSTIRGWRPPEEEDDVVGILLWDNDLGEQSNGTIVAATNPGIPVKAWRDPNQQVNLNLVYDHEDPLGGKDGKSPYTASNDYDDQNPYGERWYPEGTTFTGLDPAFWVQTQRTLGGEPGEEEIVEVVYARYATKDVNTHNIVRPGTYSELDENRFNPNWFPNAVPPSFAIQVDTGNGWKTYQRVDHWFKRSAGTTYRRDFRNYNASGFSSYARSETTHHSELSESELESYIENRPASFYGWQPLQGYMRMDPRTHRFGFTEARHRDFATSIRDTLNPNSNTWQGFRGGSGGVPLTTDPSDTKHRIHVTTENSDHLTGFFRAAGLMTNNPDPEDPTLEHPARYRDRDGLIRPGDAYFGDGTGVVPSVPARYQDRPLILNRPFRSPADLGYVFRDLPWKTLDFASRHSGDLGLLEVFSIEETEGATPMVAGKVNLNTQRPEVLEVLLRGTLRRFGDINPNVDAGEISDDLATDIADRIVEESQASPLAHPGDLVHRVLHSDNGNDVLEGIIHKPEREAALRTLAALGDIRTWNLMIDVVAQTGRFTSASQEPEDFLVTGQRRYWVHVAMDRLTGEIIDIKKETVFD